MIEQRYRAVLEAGAGVAVTEVAERYGVSRQSVHAWLRCYRQEGITWLEDRSHRVREDPWRIPAEVEKAICELRRAYSLEEFAGHPAYNIGQLRDDLEAGPVGRSQSQVAPWMAMA